ncbi:MAG: ABC transporter permease [Deltaproteobacteria bacterium]|nr:ABC transporter permease [Deltaproteobacteria bacterium]
MMDTVGAKCIAVALELFAFLRLFFESVVGIFFESGRPHFRLRQVIDQMYAIGVESLPVIVFSLTFTSLMLIIEFSYHMKLVVRQDSLVPAFSTVLMLRELGPVITSLLLTSRVGASIAAEIATMKVTEQLDALRQLSIDPVAFLTVPRWFGCVFATVSLSYVALGVAILGGSAMAALKMHYPQEQFFNTMFIFTHYEDFLCCGLKAAVFGTIIPLVASHHGFRCKPGAEGVGNATTAAVVHSTMLIIISDFLLTYSLYAV